MDEARPSVEPNLYTPQWFATFLRQEVATKALVDRPNDHLRRSPPHTPDKRMTDA